MRLTVTRHGGFAGIPRAWTLEIDELDDAEDWRNLIDSLDWQNRLDRSSADRFTYRVECDARRTELAEGALSDPWRRVIELARECGTAERPPRTPDTS